MIRRLLAAGFVAALLVGGAATASAAATTTALPAGLIPCMDRDLPEPARPSDGIASSIDGGPAKVVDGDPFAEQPKVSIYEVYGYGPGLHDYDAGCTNTGFATGIANLQDTVTKTLIASVTSLARYIFDPNFMSFLTPVFKFATDAFGYRFFIPLIGLAVALTGLWMLMRSKQNVAATADSAAGVVIVCMIAFAAIIYPFTIGTAIDKMMTGAITTASDSVSRTAGDRTVADSMASTMTKALVYEPWVAGNFGRGNAEAGQKYGPELWRTATFTRAEEAKIAADPAAAGDIIDAHKDAANEVLDKIADEYPAAYSYLAGNQGTARVGYGFLTLFAAASSLLVLAYSLYRVLWAMVFVRLAVAVAPLIAIAAQHPKWRWLMLGLLNVAGGTLVSAGAFAVIAMVVIGAAVGALLSVNSGLPGFAALLLMALLNLALWRLTKKLRKAGPAGMAWSAVRGKKMPVPTVIPEAAFPDPHNAPKQAPTTAPPESSFVQKATVAAVTAGVGAATGGAAAGIAAKAATAGVTAAATQITAKPAKAPAHAGIVMHQAAALPATPEAAPAEVQRPVVVQGTVIPPEAGVDHRTRGVNLDRGSWEPRVYTPPSTAPGAAPETAPARPQLAIDSKPVSADLYTIGG